MNFNLSMTAIVTGGAGFIGSHLCDMLLRQGYQVICLDNLITGSKKNVVHLEGNANFQFIKADVGDPFIPNADIGAIFHLASPASPIDYQRFPLPTMLANSQGTHNFLQLAKTTGAKFLLASTSEVYGDPQQHPQKEDYWGHVNPIGQRACYDESKRFAEAMTMVFARNFSTDVRIVRIFNTYGPRLKKDDGRVISNFIIQALAGKPLTVYGDGNQTRSFCYVSDMVDGLIKAMFRDNTAGEVFNLGNPDEFTVSNLARMVTKLVGQPLVIDNKPLPADDPKQRRPDISKAETMLDWRPVVSLEQGLLQTIDYFKRQAL